MYPTMVSINFPKEPPPLKYLNIDFSIHLILEYRSSSFVTEQFITDFE